MLSIGTGAAERQGRGFDLTRASRLLLLVAAVVVALLLGSAGKALAQQPGSLSQLASPNDCYQQRFDGTSECGSGGANGTGLAGTTDVVVSPDGANVYVLSTTDDSIAEFARGAGGSLTPLGAPNNCIAQSGVQSSCANETALGLYQPQAIAISPDGNTVYVAGQDAPRTGDSTLTGGNGAVAVFDRNPDGSLTQRAPEDCIAENSTRPGRARPAPISRLTGSSPGRADRQSGRSERLRRRRQRPRHSGLSA